MTTPTRKVKRETRSTLFECGKVRTMMIQVERGNVTVWPKGCRRKYVVDLAAVWQRLVKAEVDRERREKRRRKR